MPVKPKAQKMIEAKQTRTHILEQLEAGKELRRMFKAELDSAIREFMDRVEGDYTGVTGWAREFDTAEEAMAAFILFLRTKE